MNSVWAKQKAFTIVELLIVIVVIAILAAVTIVAYNGMQDRARTSAVSSELASAGRKLLAEKSASTTELYPTQLSAAGISSTQVSLTYYPNNVSNPASFCLTGTKDQQAYYVTSFDTSPREGSCEVTQGLKGWWKLNGNASDSSGNGYNGTIVSALSTTGMSGQPDTAYSFGSGRRIDIPTSSVVTGDGPYSLSAWFQAGSFCGCGIVGWGGWGATNQATALRFDTSLGGSLRLYWWYTDMLVSAPNVANNAWHHVVATYNGSQRVLYVDGVEVGRDTPGAPHAAVASTAYIGMTNTSEYFGGKIDDVRIYSRAVSADDVQTLYAAGAQ